MMNRGNMGKEISTAPKSKKVKKMMMGGMARPGMPGTMGPGSGMGGSMGPGGMTRAAPGTPQAGMIEAMLNRRAAGMKKGGKVTKKADGGAVMGYAKGGMASRGDGCCMKGKTKGTMR